MTINIRQMAKLSGVSVATVSRVMNRQPGIRPATEKKVRDCIEQYGYAPKMIKRQKNANVSAIVPWNTANDSVWYVGQLIQGLGNYAFANHKNFGILPIDTEMTGRVDIIQELSQNNIDGVIIINATTDSDYVQDLHKYKIPYILINEDQAGTAHHIVADSRSGTEKMTQYLLDLGHRDILFIEGDNARSDVRERIAGFIAAMQQAGIADAKKYLFSHSGYPGNPYEKGYNVISQMLIQGHGKLPYSAIIANCDAVALGCSKACREHNLSIPEDVSIVGYDDSHYGEYNYPPFSTIRQPLKKMSELAMSEVIRMITEGFPEQPVSHTIPVEIIIRESTGQCPV
ncbi:MAG: LacI family transcriptional regulator [Victivallaceae bacterium]|nr:LacI family transcriptional regulator [Victivallaceae bacterium]